MHVKNTKPHIPKSDINPILNDLKDALEKGILTFGTEGFENEFAITYVCLSLKAKSLIVTSEFIRSTLFVPSRSKVFPESSYKK